MKENNIGRAALTPARLTILSNLYWKDYLIQSVLVRLDR